MPLLKYTFYFSDGRNNGFSNSLYRETSSTVLGQTLLGMDLLRVWCPLLGTGVKATYMRESFDEVLGDGLLTEVPADPAFSGSATQPMEQAGSCVLVQMANAALTRKKPFYMHAIWDSRIVGGVLVTPSGWVTRENNFFQSLKGGWGWKGVTGKTQAGILTAVPSGDNQLLLTVNAPIFAGPFDGRKLQVFLSGLATIPKLKNPVIVRPLSTTTCATVKQFTNPTLAGAQLTVKNYAFFPGVNVSAIRPTTHKVGRVFRPQAGGRSKR